MVELTMSGAAQLMMATVMALMDWSGAIEAAYVDAGVSEDLYPKEALVALLEVESCGRPEVVKGKFVGPLQLGPSYLVDAGSTRAQAGTMYGAVLAWAKVQRRYRVRREGDPELVIPIMHKGGPGTLKSWRKSVINKRRSMTHAEQVALADRVARRHGVHGMGAFLERYTAARMGAGWWCGKTNLPRMEKKT